GWWHLEREGHRPAYPFGFGLAYTTFALTDTAVAAGDGALRVRGRLTNTGARPGSDVIQVYARRQGDHRPRRLVGFRRIDVPPGRTVPVELTVPVDALAVRDVEAHAMVVPPGDYDVWVARHAADLDHHHSVHLG